MSLKSFLELNNLSTKGIEILESLKYYEGTEENILFIRLPKMVQLSPDGVKQDYLVMSRGLASIVRADSSNLSKSQVTETSEGLGLIKQSCEVLATIDL